jgi:hypothetical protein
MAVVEGWRVVPHTNVPPTSYWAAAGAPDEPPRETQLGLILALLNDWLPVSCLYQKTQILHIIIIVIIIII